MELESLKYIWRTIETPPAAESDRKQLLALAFPPDPEPPVLDELLAQPASVRAPARTTADAPTRRVRRTVCAVRMNLDLSSTGWTQRPALSADRGRTGGLALDEGEHDRDHEQHDGDGRAVPGPFEHLARVADEVEFVVAGLPMRVK